MMKIIFGLLAAIAISCLATSPANASDAAELFKSRCQMCHAIDRKKMGPAVKNMTVDTKTLRATISNGRKMMPPYAAVLDAEQIDTLVDYIKAQQ